VSGGRRDQYPSVKLKKCSKVEAGGSAEQCMKMVPTSMPKRENPKDR